MRTVEGRPFPGAFPPTRERPASVWERSAPVRRPSAPVPERLPHRGGPSTRRGSLPHKWAGLLPQRGISSRAGAGDPEVRGGPSEPRGELLDPGADACRAGADHPHRAPGPPRAGGNCPPFGASRPHRQFRAAENPMRNPALDDDGRRAYHAHPVGLCPDDG